MDAGDDQRGDRPSGGDRITARGREFRLSHHAATQMVRRGVSIGRVRHVLANAAVVFDYYHDFEWKTGHYDRATHTLVAVVGGSIVTVVTQVSPEYVGRLRTLMP